MHLARIHARLQFLRLMNWRIASGTGVSPADASATKVFGTEFATEAYRLLTEVIGANGYVRADSPAAVRGRPRRADGAFVADPDVRRRDERGAARHHRRGRAQAAGGSALMDFALPEDVAAAGRAGARRSRRIS